MTLIEPGERGQFSDSNDFMEVEQEDEISIKVQTFMNVRNKTQERLLLEKYFKALRAE